MHKKLTAVCVCVMLFLVGTLPASAGIFSNILTEMKNVDKDQLQGVLGVGALYETEPYIDVDEETTVVPLAALRYKRLWADGRTFGVTLNDYESDDIEISLVGSPRFMGYEADDSPALAGMQDRDGSFDGGLRAEWGKDNIELTVTGLMDLAGEHDGQEISALISAAFVKGAITPRVGVKWMSQNLVDHYFGVTGPESNAVRPVYEPDGSVNFVAGVTLALPIGEKLALVSDIEYENLGSEIQDSPIVDANEVMRYVGGIVYRF